MAESTRERILDAALRAYGTDGFAATSLDALAADLGIRKQTILYYFPSKHAVFEAVVDRAASDLVKVFEEEAARGIDGLDQVEAIVKRVFRLAVRQPQLLGLIREVTRPGSLSIDRLSAHTAPIFDRARDFLQREMDAGRMKAQRPRDAPAVALLDRGRGGDRAGSSAGDGDLRLPSQVRSPAAKNSSAFFGLRSSRYSATTSARSAESTRRRRRPKTTSGRRSLAGAATSDPSVGVREERSISCGCEPSRSRGPSGRTGPWR